LAVDLSLASLAYAQRKTSELNLSNVEYAQADITLLGSLDRRFDFIESFGVLHHLADPVAGWRTLLSLLRPGGCMAVGLYSAQARVAVVAARDYIARQGYSATPADIRRARQDLMRATEPGLSETLASFRDFFTTSECRDLLFHVQEHRFTLPQLEQAIAELGVRFMGFLVPPSIRREYSRRFPDDREQTSLRHWAEFESEFPYTFLGMYGFWVQKPGATPAGYSAFAAPDRPASLH
jgi:SAM-dependent methyltransferase